MKEIEILYTLEESIASAKRKFGALPWKITQTQDTYFTSGDHSRLSPNSDNRLTSSFRLREQGDFCKLTYKNDHFDDRDTWLYSDEHEIEVSSAGIMKEILTALHYRELVIIKNTKHLCDVDGYEIALEEVKDLGNFIEIEYTGETEISDEAVEPLKASIRAYLHAKNLCVGEELNAGKPELLLKKKRESP